MAEKESKGIVPIIASLLPGIISGLSKKNRDKATPKTGGGLRDAGVGLLTGVGCVGLAQAKGMIDCATLHLPDEYCGLVQGVALVLGALMYIFGAGQKEKENTPKKINIDDKSDGN